MKLNRLLFKLIALVTLLVVLAWPLCANALDPKSRGGIDNDVDVFIESLNPTMWLRASDAITASQVELVTAPQDLTDAAWTNTRTTDAANQAFNPYGEETLVGEPNDFTSSAWTKNQVDASLPGDVANPVDGKYNVSLIEENTTSSTSFFTPMATSPTYVSGNVYKASIYAKEKGRKSITVYANTSANYSYATYTLTGSGSVSGTNNVTASITSVGDGWYLIEHQFTANASAAGLFSIYGNSSGLTYNGNLDAGWYLYGARLEQATADELIEDSSSSTTHFITDSMGTLTAGETYELAVIAKRGSGSRETAFRFQGNAFTGQPRVWFDLDDCTVGTTESGISASNGVDLGSGWCEFRAQRAADSTDTAEFVIYIAQADNDVTCTGDASSSIYIANASFRRVSNAVTQWDSKVGSISFTQSTVASQPVLSTGGVENLYTNSEDVSTGWTNTRSSDATDQVANPVNGAVDADQLIDDGTAGNSHYMYQAVSTVSGEPYTLSLYAKRVSRHISIRATWDTVNVPFAHFDLSDCTVNAVEDTVTAAAEDLGSGWCRISATEISDATGASSPWIALASTPGTTTYNGDSSSSAYVWGMQFRRADTPPTYVATTNAQVHGSTTGRKGIVFDGSDDDMSSTSTLDDIFNNNAKTSIIVADQETDNNGGFLTDGAVRYYEWYNATANGIGVNHSDGVTDTTSNAWTVPGPFISVLTHDGTNITTELYGVGTDTVASGNTADMTNTLWVGSWDSAGHFDGPIYEVITFDKVLDARYRARIIQGLKRVYGID